MKNRKLNTFSNTSHLDFISPKKYDDTAKAESPDMLKFRRLFAQYKAKMLEQHANLFQ